MASMFEEDNPCGGRQERKKPTRPVTDKTQRHRRALPGLQLEKGKNIMLLAHQLKLLQF